MAEERLEDFSVTSQNEDTLMGKYLTFALGPEEYGIEIRFVTEIVGITPITFVPDQPAFIKGIINLRGKIIPVLDMRAYFNMPPIDYNDRTCFIVVDIKGYFVALVVDYVLEVTKIDQISESSELNESGSRRYMQGIGRVGESIKLLLNCSTLLGVDDLDSLPS